MSGQSGPFQIGEGGAVGGHLLSALVGHEIAGCEAGTAGHDPGSGLGRLARSGGRARCRDAETQEAGHGGQHLGVFDPLAKPELMAPGQMPHLMGKNALQLARCFRRQDRTGVDEDTASGNEGVEIG